MRMLQRDDFHFFVIQQISDEAFQGIERPPALALRYQFDNCECFVHEIESRIVAYAIVVTDGGEPYIWSIATKKEFRGRGIASGLLREICDFYHARYAKCVALTVNADNPAQKLYFDQGFRVVKYTPRYYGEFAGLRMRRYL